MTERETIERDGRRFVLVPQETYERMLDEIDELAAIRAYDRAKAAPQEMVPAEIVDRLLSGENPVKVWREHRGRTQQRLADAIGISKPYLSQLEHGQREASIKVLRALAAALAVDLEDLAPTSAARRRRMRRRRPRRAPRRRGGGAG
jgi:DNA-binding XRE family transcriptional regulator